MLVLVNLSCKVWVKSISTVCEMGHQWWFVCRLFGPLTKAPNRNKTKQSDVKRMHNSWDILHKSHRNSVHVWDCFTSVHCICWIVYLILYDIVHVLIIYIGVYNTKINILNHILVILYLKFVSFVFVVHWNIVIYDGTILQHMTEYENCKPGHDAFIHLVVSFVLWILWLHQRFLWEFDMHISKSFMCVSFNVLWAQGTSSQWRHYEHHGGSNHISTFCSAVCSGVHQRKHQSSALLALVKGIHRWPVDSPHKGPVTRIHTVFLETTDGNLCISNISEIACCPDCTKGYCEWVFKSAQQLSTAKHWMSPHQHFLLSPPHLHGHVIKNI